MGAEFFGAKLLAEVKTESLADILRDLHKSHSPCTPERLVLGIKPIDDVLALLKSAQSPNKPYNPIVEITSPASGDGKTQLLYYTAALAVLPARVDTDIHLGGYGAAVIWLDTDGRFDARRFRTIMTHLTRKGMAAARLQHPANVFQDETALRMLLDEASRHVHVFRPQSSVALLATLKSIPDYLFSMVHYSRQRKVHAVVLDSASAFYWQDRRETEISRIPGAIEDEEQQRQKRRFDTQDDPFTSAERKKGSVNVHGEIVSCLRGLQERFSCMILFTTAGLFAAPSLSPAFLSFRPYLPHPWPAFSAIRIVVRKDPVRPFGEWMTVEEAKRDATARQSVVQRGRFSAWVDPASISAGLRNLLEEYGLFGFKVTQEGIAFDDG